MEQLNLAYEFKCHLKYNPGILSVSKSAKILVHEHLLKGSHAHQNK